MKTVIRYSLLCWAIFYVIIIFLFSPLAEMEVVLLRTTSFILPQIALFYINLIFLLPNFFEQNKTIGYFLSLVILIGLNVVLFGSLDVYFDKVIPLDLAHLNQRPESFVYIGRFMSSVPPIIIAALIRKSVLLQVKTRESMELQNKMLAAETKALKAQINPHFLFNTLNNIYSLSQFDNKKTGEAILQLSDILRYVTYEGDQKQVPLTLEVEHIQSFLKLQLLRDEDATNIYLDIDEIDPQLKISPLLLIPFVENAFKHGNHHNKTKGWIKIKISTKGDQLLLNISNSISEQPIKTDRVGGVGMENVKKRLSLLYPKKHDLVLKINKTSYEANLTINLLR